MVTIKRINVGSAAKVGAVISLVLAALFGLFIFGFQALFVGAFAGFASSSTGTSFSASGGDLFSGVSLVFLCVFYIVYVVMSAVGGAISGLLVAFAYNLTSGWIGGLEVELEDSGDEYDQKLKRRTRNDSIYE